MPLTSATVRQLALSSGFDLAGVSAAGDFRELDVFPEWLAEGRAGDMAYLAARNEDGDLKRASLKNAAPWARSVIVCAVNYNSDQPYSTECTDPARGWISRYAWSQRDYHDVILPKLRELESRIAALAREDNVSEFRSWSYVDTGPVIERVYAKYAGVGWIAKNTCIINQELGSWLFLGVILTSLPLTPDLPAADRCGSCTRCIDACPTNAFPKPYELDASRCIAYLTIEKRGPIPEDLRSGIGRNIFGCDICQDVCPWNNKDAFRDNASAELVEQASAEHAEQASAERVEQASAERVEQAFRPASKVRQENGASAPEARTRPTTSEPAFFPRPELVNPSLDWLASLSPEEFRSFLSKSPIKRTKFAGVRRNVVTAMGNSGRIEFIPRLEELAHDADSAVAEHARWALRQLRNRLG